MKNTSSKFKPGDKAYIIESRFFIREVEIIRFMGGLYTIRFIDSKGGIKVREDRLYSTKEEAEGKLPPKKTQYKSPWN